MHSEEIQNGITANCKHILSVIADHFAAFASEYGKQVIASWYADPDNKEQDIPIDRFDTVEPKSIEYDDAYYDIYAMLTMVVEFGGE